MLDTDREKRCFVEIRSQLLRLCAIVGKKQSLHSTGQALRVPRVLDSQISIQLAREGGKVVRPKHRLPLPPREYSWYSFLLEAESTPGP